MPISAHLCQASAMLLAVCPLVAALQTGFGRPGLVQAPSVSTGPARFAAASPYSSARLPAVSMIATDQSPVVDDLTKYYEGDAPLEERMWEYVKKRGGDRLIRRILIANNGMAATKSIMSIRQWAYETFGDEKAVEFVVMATPEDLTANAEFIRRADEFIEVPGGSNANNYANVQLIVDLCLSENVRPTSRPPTLAPATHALALAPPSSLAACVGRLHASALRAPRAHACPAHACPAHASAHPVPTPLLCRHAIAGGRRHGRLGPRLREPQAGRHAQGALGVWLGVGLACMLEVRGAPLSASCPCRHQPAAARPRAAQA